MVVAGPFLHSNLSFGTVRFVNYVGIKIWFVKLMQGLVYFAVFFEFVSCLYHLRSPSRETIADVSIGTWAEKGLSN